MTGPFNGADAPSSRQLVRSTLIAAAIAGVILVTCVLPAEYGKDPTGVGRLLGLTQMGEVKVALAEEEAANHAAEASADSVIAAAEAAPIAANAQTAAASGAAAVSVSPNLSAEDRSDTTIITLAPGKGGEVKLRMAGNSRANYRWEITGGVVNYDMHGDSTNAPKDWFVSYKKAQRVASDSGELVAGFNGNHGWYWRNRGTREVMVRLITSGDYSRIDQHL
jgi:hypothetical protein